MIYSLYPHCNISPYGYGSKMSSSKNGWLKIYSNLWSSLQFDPSQSGGFHKWMFYIGNSWQNWWFGGHLWGYPHFRKRANWIRKICFSTVCFSISPLCYPHTRGSSHCFCYPPCLVCVHHLVPRLLRQTHVVLHDHHTWLRETCRVG